MKQGFGDEPALARAAAAFIVSIGREAAAERGRFDLVLSGGRTPVLTYERLAADHALDRGLWGRTHFYWGDERCVPPKDPASNCRTARLALLDPLRIPDAQVHRIRAEIDDPDRAAAEYDAIFPPRPDLILLGIGADGHTASLFPHAPALEEKRRRFVAVEAPVEPGRRITITPVGLSGARSLLVLVSGRAKAAALAAVLSPEGDAHQTPARLVRRACWLVHCPGPG